MTARGVRRIDDEHPRADDVVEREAGLRERAVDDREHRARLACGVARVARDALGARVGRAADEARVADRERPRVAGGRLPRAAAGDAPAGHARCRHARSPAARPPGAHLRVAADRRDQRGQQRGARHDRGDLQVLAGRMVEAADRSQPVDRRHAHARRRVRVRRPAGRRVVEREAEALRDPRRVGHQPTRPLELLHRPVARSLGDVDGDVGDHGARAGLADGGLDLDQGVAGDRAHVDLHRAALGDDVGPRPAVDDPDVDGDARPAAVERVQLGDDARRLEDRAAALLGLDAGVRGAAMDGDRRARGCPCATRRCRRWRGRTRGPGTRRRPPRGGGYAGSMPASRSPRRGWRRRRGVASGSPPRASRIAAIAYRPASRPLFMSVTPGPVAMPSVIANGPLGGGARVEHRVHVADAQQRDPVRVGPRDVRDDGLAQPELVRLGADRRAEAAQAVGRPGADLVDPGLRVAAAVDVDEALEVREVGGLRGRRRRRGARTGRRAKGWSGSAWPQSIERPPPRTHGPNAYPRRTVRLVEIRLLEGPNVYRLAPVVKVEVAVGRSRTWQGSRTGSDVHRPSRPIGARPRVAGPGRRPRRLDPPPPRGPRRARRTVEVHAALGHGTMGRHVAMGRRRAGAPDRRGRVRPGVAQRLARPPDPAHRYPGPDRRPLAGADRRGAGDTAVMDPRRRPPDAGDLDHRHQRQVDGDPPDHPHPAASRPARRHDDLGRDPGRRADGRPRRLDRSRGRPGDPAPERRRRRRAGDRPRRPRAARDGLRVERRERVHQRLVGPPRPPGDPHPRRAGGGEVDDLPGDEARRLGRAQRRRPVRRRRRPSGARAGRLVLARPGRSPIIARQRRAGGRAYVLLRRAAWSSGTRGPEHEIVDGRRPAGRARRARPPQPRERPGGGRRRAGAGHVDRPGRRRAARLPALGRAFARAA